MPPLGWDEEAQEQAEREAWRMMSRDPEGAQQLLAQLAAERAAATGQALASGEPAVVLRRAPPYDPMRLRATLAKYYGWSPFDIGRLHFVSAFAYLREAALLNEAEQRAMQTDAPPQPELTEGDLRALGATPRTWAGAEHSFAAVAVESPYPR